MHPSALGGVYATVVSRPRRFYDRSEKAAVSFASVRVEMEPGSEPLVYCTAADMRVSARHVRFGDGAAGPRDREPSPTADERASTM